MTSTGVAVVFVDFRCPNGRCGHFLIRLPEGTPIERGYCKWCGLVYKNQIALRGDSLTDAR